MSTVGWLFNFVPWWAPWLLGGVALVFTMNFWLPIWTMMPTKAKIALGAVGAGIAAWWMGRNQGAKSERDQLAKREARAESKREEIHNEVEKLDRPTVDRRLDRYYRD